ncbi:MAG: hypothetical protein JXB34_06385 [Bacteroidales bacterium]|nr:hypothetical protein [Bacteroidales bacterium]
MKKIFAVIFLLYASVNLAFSQNQEFNKSIYSFVPQYLINRGIRVDIDKKISGRHYLQICPQFYLSEKEGKEFVNDKNQFNFLVGGGVNAYHKIFTVDNLKYNGLYLAYGPSYNYFKIEYIDDSGDYDVTANATINKFGADVLLGYQILVHEIVSFDIYTGLGTRFSFMEAGGNDTNRFNDGYFGYNYTGNILLLGFRIGVAL